MKDRQDLRGQKIVKHGMGTDLETGIALEIPIIEEEAVRIETRIRATNREEGISLYQGCRNKKTHGNNTMGFFVSYQKSIS